MEFLFKYPIIFAFSYCSWGSQGKNTEVVCHSLLQWITFCQTSPPWPDCLGWPHTAWLSFIELYKAVVLWSDWLVFCDYGFSVSAFWCPLATPTSYLGFSYLGCGVSLHGCSSKAQPLLLTLDEVDPPDLEHGVAPFGPPAPVQPLLLGHGVAPLGCSCTHHSLVLLIAAPDLGYGVALLSCASLRSVTATAQDWVNRLLEGTNRTLCAPGPRGKEQWPHKRLTQTCPWVSWSLQQRRGSLVACCRVGDTVAVCAWDLLKGVTIIFITFTVVWPQVKNNTQLWMWLVMEIKFDAVNSNIS